MCSLDDLATPERAPAITNPAVIVVGPAVSVLPGAGSRRPT